MASDVTPTMIPLGGTSTLIPTVLIWLLNLPRSTRAIKSQPYQTWDAMFCSYQPISSPHLKRHIASTVLVLALLVLVIPLVKPVHQLTLTRVPL